MTDRTCPITWPPDMPGEHAHHCTRDRRWHFAHRCDCGAEMIEDLRAARLEGVL